MNLVDDVRKWVTETVRYYRALGFFQNRVAYEMVNKFRPQEEWQKTDESMFDPKFPRIPEWWTNSPLPAYALMSDEEIADFILAQKSNPRRNIEAYLKSGRSNEFEVIDFGRRFRYTREEVEVSIVNADPFRVIFTNREYGIIPRDFEYIDMLQALARISRGALTPTDVKVGMEPDEGGDLRHGNVNVFFTCQGRRYEIPTKASGDWFNEWPLVSGANELLVRLGSAYRIYYLYEAGPDIVLASLTPDEKSKLERERGWKFVKHMGLETGAADESNLIDKGKAP